MVTLQRTLFILGSLEST